MSVELNFESHGYPNPCSSAMSFDLYPGPQFSYIRINPYVLFVLSCLCIDDGVRVWVEPWRGFRIEFRAFSSSLMQTCVDIAHLSVLMVRRLPHRREREGTEGKKEEQKRKLNSKQNVKKRSSNVRRRRGNLKRNKENRAQKSSLLKGAT